jgi:hypothetical protein
MKSAAEAEQRERTFERLVTGASARKQPPRLSVNSWGHLSYVLSVLWTRCTHSESRSTVKVDRRRPATSNSFGEPPTSVTKRDSKSFSADGQELARHLLQNRFLPLPFPAIYALVRIAKVRASLQRLGLFWRRLRRVRDGWSRVILCG